MILVFNLFFLYNSKSFSVSWLVIFIKITIITISTTYAVAAVVDAEPSTKTIR